jgi:hypothetical protein
MTKVNPQNWSQIDLLINNFYEIVEYKRGRGIYGDRVILKRAKAVESIFGEPSRLYEFYYLDANAVKELPRTIVEKIKIVTRIVTSPTDMNILCDFDADVQANEWALELASAMSKAKTLDYKVLNNILIEQYKKLDGNFLSKLNKHREKQYFLASSDAFNFVTKDYATQQISAL